MSELMKTISEEKSYLMRKHLRKWKDYQYRLETAGEELLRLDEYMTSYPATLGSTPVQGGASKREDLLVNTIDAKTLVEEGLRAAHEYFTEILPAWRNLTDKERYMIKTRWIDNDGRGIQDIMSRLKCEKSDAYTKSNAALDRFASMFIS